MLGNVSWLDGARALGIAQSLTPQVVTLHHDRRYSPRLAVTLEAERFVGSERLREQVSDISAGGLMLQGCAAMPLGTRLELFLQSPTSGPGATVQAEVVRACAHGMSEAPRVGLRFVDLDDASRTALELLLVGLLPEPDDHRRLGRRFDLHVPAV
jgi:c-di-GMP-binding flagellar brake protein YcgR